MPRKRRKQKNRENKFKSACGYVAVNKIDYTRRDYMSPGKLVAWADYIWIEDGKGA